MTRFYAVPAGDTVGAFDSKTGVLHINPHRAGSGTQMAIGADLNIENHTLP